MKQRKLACRIEELEIKTHIVRDLLLAVSEAVQKGDYAVSNYEWAFYNLSLVATELNKETIEVKNQAFKELRKDMNNERIND